MDLTLTPTLLYIASWLTVTGGIWSLFERAESVASQESKSEIALWINRLTLPKGISWPLTFSSIFDKIFGHRHWSIRCFLASSFTSLVSVVILSILAAALHPEEMKNIFEGEIILPLLGLIIGALIFNLLPDYISLLETRFILQLLVRRNSPLLTALLLTIDFFLTGAIGMCILGLITIIAPGDWQIFQRLLATGLLLKSKDGISFSFGIFFYSTFFTSVWIWLYIISGFFAGLLRQLGVFLNLARKFLDIEGKPLRSLGFVAMMIVTVIYILIPVF